jgi:hypothetical protein
VSAIVFSRFHLHPGADRIEFANRVLENCRFQRSLPGRLNSRYYWADTNTIVMLTEVESPSDVFAQGPNEAGARTMFALSDVANRTGFEVWMGAREGTEANRMAGR